MPALAILFSRAKSRKKHLGGELKNIFEKICLAQKKKGARWRCFPSNCPRRLGALLRCVWKLTGALAGGPSAPERATVFFSELHRGRGFFFYEGADAAKLLLNYISFFWETWNHFIKFCWGAQNWSSAALVQYRNPTSSCPGRDVLSANF